MLLRHFFLLVPLATSLLCLAACTTQAVQPENTTVSSVSPQAIALTGVASGAAIGQASGIGLVPGAAVGGIVGTAIGYNEYQKAMASLGVRTLYQNDKTLIYLPTDTFFIFNTPTLRNQANAALDNIVAMLHQKGHSTVTINGYTDNIGSKAHQRWLSTMQAQSVASYLWAHGIAAERLVVEGMGDQNPIANNLTIKGRTENRRVEIIAARA